jgi:peptidoglycan/xylan/chitin deacetylase (PgdA/CDA1 family)
MKRQKRLQGRKIGIGLAGLLLLGSLLFLFQAEAGQPVQTTAEQRKVALTFDDGPSPLWTEPLLEGLKERNVKATFFVTGENAEAYPEILQKMQAEGHLIGNHSYSHVQLTAIGEEQALEEIYRTNEAIYNCTGTYPEFLRPPFGSIKEELEKKTDMMVVLWDVDPTDWCRTSVVTITKSVVENVQDHSIILLHDQYESSVKAALQIVDTLQKEGYEFVTVDEILLD